MNRSTATATDIAAQKATLRAQARETLRRARGSSNGPAAVDEEALASGIERLALRIETVAARLEATQL